MSMGAQWPDFQTVSNLVYHNTVDRLKLIIQLINLHLSAHLARSGKKQDLIDRIQHFLRSLDPSVPHNTNRWATVRSIIKQEPLPSTIISTPGASSSTAAAALPRPSQPIVPASSHTSSVAYNSSWRAHAAPAAVSTTTAARPSIRWKPSPFHTVHTALTDIIPASEVRVSNERGNAAATFTITQAQRQQLNAGTHQVRVYCTSGQFHSSSSGLWASQICPIEFPPICEIRVNGATISANTRGVKKKPGTAPPVDISKAVPAGSNRVDLTYVNNSTNPFVPKKYYVVVNLVEYTDVDTLVKNLRTSRGKSSESVKNTLWNSQANEDDDIIAGAQTMTLKCPLSYMRITTPCRSQACAHAQCFDAASWYAMMEQTSTYMCPTCDKTLAPEALIMDGFFNEILLNVPESVEDVVVEPNGEWHTADGKYHSIKWRPPPPLPPRAAVAAKREPSARPASRSSSFASHLIPAKRQGTGSTSFVIIESDSEGDQPSSRLQGSRARPLSSGQSSNQVIDLTLSSDDDDDDTAVHSTSFSRTPADDTNKRKATDVYSGSDAASAKRTRLDDNYSNRSPPPSHLSSDRYATPTVNGSDWARSNGHTRGGSSGASGRHQSNSNHASGSLSFSGYSPRRMSYGNSSAYDAPQHQSPSRFTASSTGPQLYNSPSPLQSGNLRLDTYPDRSPIPRWPGESSNGNAFTSPSDTRLPSLGSPGSPTSTAIHGRSPRDTQTTQYLVPEHNDAPHYSTHHRTRYGYPDVDRERRWERYRTSPRHPTSDGSLDDPNWTHKGAGGSTRR